MECMRAWGKNAVLGSGYTVLLAYLEVSVSSNVWHISIARPNEATRRFARVALKVKDTVRAWDEAPMGSRV